MVSLSTGGFANIRFLWPLTSESLSWTRESARLLFQSILPEVSTKQLTSYSNRIYSLAEPSSCNCDLFLSGAKSGANSRQTRLLDTFLPSWVKTSTSRFCEASLPFYGLLTLKRSPFSLFCRIWRFVKDP